MREILFRGKQKDNGEWVYGDLIHRKVWKSSIILIRTYDYGFGKFKDAEIVPETVGQYTGLLDKNGKKIFEGDIVKAFKHNEEQFICTITYRVGCFWFGNWNWCEFLNIFRNYEVIGNIHDNGNLF